MIRALALSLSAVMLAGPTVPMYGPIYDGPPPIRFQGQAGGLVFFLDSVNTLCGPNPPNGRILACSWQDKAGNHIMVLPNPNNTTDELFRRLAAHELGHWLGWSGNHEVA